MSGQYSDFSQFGTLYVSIENDVCRLGLSEIAEYVDQSQPTYPDEKILDGSDAMPHQSDEHDALSRNSADAESCIKIDQQKTGPEVKNQSDVGSVNFLIESADLFIA